MRSAGYRHLDAAVLRAAALKPDTPDFWPELDRDEDGHGSARAWLKAVWLQPGIAEAVAIASPVLAKQVAGVCGGRRPTVRQLRRMVISIARYLVRVRGRATPFGVFAGVAPLRFGPAVSTQWDGSGYARYRADARWLAAVIKTLEACDDLRERLTVRSNDLAYVRGTRLVIPWMPHSAGTDGVYGAELSLRNSPALRMARHMASSPIRLGDLRDKIETEVPNASSGSIDRMLGELLAHGVLISSLRPCGTSTDALAHVLAELDRVDAGSVPAAAPLVSRLRETHAKLTIHERGGSPVRDRMRDVSNVVEQPLLVDFGVRADTVLPEQVAREAATAGELLVRLTPHPDGTSGWRKYHERFLTRYGAGAIVPVRELVDTTTGIGFPAHFAESEPKARVLSGRDEVLLGITQQAALDGAREIVLDDAMVDQIGGNERDHQVPHADLCAEVHASSHAALSNGTFTLVVTGAGRSAVALTGRFLDLFPAQDRCRMQDAYFDVPTGVAGALPAQLSFPPSSARTDNVARTPRIVPSLISLAEYRDDDRDVISVDDLAVTADARRMYVLSRAQHRVVEPLITNATARHTWPPLARLLFELPRARAASMAPFAWGAAGALPYLPRIRYGRTVLARARWRAPAGTLARATESRSAWAEAVARLRDRMKLPAWVSVGESDRRLVLNLDEPMDRDLLRAHVRKVARAGEPVVLTEATTPEDYGWLDGRAHEIVVPLASTAAPAPAPAAVMGTGPTALIRSGHGVLPGGDVVFAKLYGHPGGVEEILTRHLPRLLAGLRAEWGEPPLWWFVRFRDPEPHLRVRFHLPAHSGYGAAAERIGTWAGDLRHGGLAGDLVLDTYHPEIARYGHGACLAAAERLFAADSAAVVAQLGVRAGREADPVAVTAASMINLAGGMTGDYADAMRWLVQHATTRPADSAGSDGTLLPDAQGARDRLDPALVRGARRLADPQQVPLRTLRGGAEVADAWAVRRRTAAAYAERLKAEYDGVKQDSVIASLLHLHHVRGHGIDTACERMCLRVARAVAVSWTARRPNVEEPSR